MSVWSLATLCPRSFECRRCGDPVLVDERSDRRTVFCSAYCEREFWRHRSRYERDKDISHGHATDESRDRWMLEKGC